MIFAAFAVATAGVLAVSAYAAWRDFRSYGDELGAAGLLALLLELSVLCRSGDPGGVGNMVWLALFDFCALALSVWWFATHPRLWKFLLALSFLLQLFAHAGFWSGWNAGADNRYAYIAFLNAVAMLQLVAVGFPGGRYVARDVGHAVRVRRATHFHAHHGPMG